MTSTPPHSKPSCVKVAKTLIPNALCYSIRQVLNVELPWDELAVMATHADFNLMSVLMSIRANAGSAEKIASFTGDFEEPSHA